MCFVDVLSQHRKARKRYSDKNDFLVVKKSTSRQRTQLATSDSENAPADRDDQFDGRQPRATASSSSSRLRTSIGKHDGAAAKSSHRLIDAQYRSAVNLRPNGHCDVANVKRRLRRQAQTENTARRRWIASRRIVAAAPT